MYDESLEDYNLEKKADDFINYFRDMQTHYKQNVLIHTMGSDFQYMDAKMNFMNMDRLLHHLAKDENVAKYNATVIYSTVGKYVKRINELNITTYETKTDDFFPYASDVSDYWTGYFTSRVNSKYLIKETGRFL
jgi:lysosomal alpha-mannosidase